MVAGSSIRHAVGRTGRPAAEGPRPAARRAAVARGRNLQAMTSGATRAVRRAPAVRPAPMTPALLRAAIPGRAESRRGTADASRQVADRSPSELLGLQRGAGN